MPQNEVVVVAVPSRGRADAGLQRLPADASAAGELYEKYARRIYGFCFGRLRSREEAEDATQSTFLNAFRGLQRGVAPEHEAAWLYKIAENVCLTRQRSSTRRRRVESPEDLQALQDVLPTATLESDELFHLPEALRAMPEQQRRALLLREWQGLSYHEIADELGLSHSAVETLLFRARRSLAAGLDDEAKRAKKGIARRLRAGTDAGSVFALLKTLLFSGGAKVLIAGATVAATSVVAATPSVRHAVEHAVAATPAKPHVSQPVVPVAPAQVEHGAPSVVERPAATSPPAHAAAAEHRWRHGRHLGSARRAAVAGSLVPRSHVVSVTHSHAALAKTKPAPPVQSQRKSTVHVVVPTRASTTHSRSHQTKPKPVKPASSAAPNHAAKQQAPAPTVASSAPQPNGHTPNGVANGHSDAAHGKSSH